MSKMYGSYFKWGIDAFTTNLPESINSCFVTLDWAKIMPSADGKPDFDALKEYKTHLENFILEQKKPVVILSDGTLPQYLADAGGWGNRDTADKYLEYAIACFSALSECAETWVTFEELTSEFFLLSKSKGKFTVPKKAELQSLHNMLLAHGMTVKHFKQAGIFGRIGIGLSLANFIPNTPSKEDKRACKTFDLLCNRWVPSMLDHGMYPYFSSLRLFPMQERPTSKKTDPETIAQVVDFVLVSFHSGITVGAQKTEEVLHYRHSPIVDEQSSLLYLARKMYHKMKLPMLLWDKRIVSASEELGDQNSVYWQLEQLLLDWVDVRGYFVPCKDVNAPSVRRQNLIKYIEQQ